jgi:hypothetical protein
MNIRDLSKRIAGFILGFTFLLGAVLGATITVNAQYRDNDQYRRDRNWDRYGNYGGSAELRQAALNAGYNEGVRESADDRRYNRRLNYQDATAYQQATKDYRKRLGDRELYRRYFREAFESGYNSYANSRGNLDRDNRDRNRDGDGNVRSRRGRNWDGYGNFGGTSELRQTALNAGYNEGNKQGQKDRNGRNSGFQGQSAYQKATKDYNSRLGDRSVYQQYFREAYENGYSDGLNGY